MGDPGSALPPASSSSIGVPAGPLTFGQVLDRIYKLVKANLRPFLGIASVPALAFIVLYGLMLTAIFSVVKPWHPQAQPTFTPMTALMMAAAGILCLLLSLVFALYEAAACYAAVQANAGARVTAGEAWGAALKKAGRYIWLMILRSLVLMVPVIAVAVVVGIVIALAVMRSHGEANPDQWILVFPIMILAYAFWIVYMILVMIRLALAYPASVAENLTAWSSVVRSNRLTKGGRGRIFLVALVIYAITYAAMMVLEIGGFALFGLGMLVGLLFHLPMAPWGFIGIGVLGLIVLVAFFLFIAITWSAFETSLAVIYHDQRLRKEGVAPAPLPAPSA